MSVIKAHLPVQFMIPVVWRLCCFLIDSSCSFNWIARQHCSILIYVSSYALALLLAWATAEHDRSDSLMLRCIVNWGLCRIGYFIRFKQVFSALKSVQLGIHQHLTIIVVVCWILICKSGSHEHSCLLTHIRMKSICAIYHSKLLVNVIGDQLLTGADRAFAHVGHFKASNTIFKIDFRFAPALLITDTVFRWDDQGGLVCLRLYLMAGPMMLASLVCDCSIIW